jgi:uncharacterized protein YggE
MMKQLIVSLLCLLAAIMPAAAAEEHLPPSVTVTGVGKTFAKPDTAHVSIGVTAQATTAKAAVADNSSAMTSLIATIKHKGIADKDIQTSFFNVNPVYDNSNNRFNQSKVVGYRVSNQVSVKVRNLDVLGDLLDAAVENGANTINGVSFSVDNPDPFLDKARQLAVVDAHRKAELYAGAANLRLGRVLYITESGAVSPPVPRMFAFAAAAPMQAAVPIESGENRMQETVTVIYAIE